MLAVSIANLILIVICNNYFLALCSNPSSPSNGAVTSAGNSVGDTATYTCNTGFELIGYAEATCTLSTDGNSASFMPAQPICRRKFSMVHACYIYRLLFSALCTNASSPSNGEATSAGNSVGDAATYTCNTGFELIGQAVATCTLSTNGNSASFLPAQPICRRKWSWYQ